MKTNISNGMPIANLCLNKSRLKIYNKDSEIPTYYLQKGSEFAIELFNPTTNTILAKIFLNGKPITQGGLVLRPAERVFLERYIDIAKKFLFDTYEVSNTNEVKRAIENNGDFKVEFYNESKPYYNPLNYCDSLNLKGINIPINSGNIGGAITFGTSNGVGTLNLTGNIGTTITNTTMGSLNLTGNIGNLVQDSLSDFSNPQPKPEGGNFLRKKSKTIETGIVEAGSNSDQKLKTVNKNFDLSPFHIIEYKMLPISQKINTVDDMKVRVYCHNCGEKLKPEFKFCPKCGVKGL